MAAVDDIATDRRLSPRSARNSGERGRQSGVDQTALRIRLKSTWRRTGSASADSSGYLDSPQQATA